MEVLTDCDVSRVRDLLARDVFFWMDLEHPSNATVADLRELFGVHPAAMEDTREWDQLPKVDDYGDHLLVVFFSAERLDGRTRPVEVHVYLSGRWVLTVSRSETPLRGIHDSMRDEDTSDEDMIVYRVLDTLADGWDPVIDDVDARVDVIEEQVLDRPRQEQLRVIYRLKQEVSDLLRHAHKQAFMMPQAVTAIHALPGLSRSSREWLQDVVSHGESIASDLRRLAEDLNALTDTFFNANANRLNRLVTYVTIGSVFFLLWTLVTGFFGQNFGYLVRHIDTKAAFLGYELGSLVIPTIVLAALFYWRRRDWL